MNWPLSAISAEVTTGEFCQPTGNFGNSTQGAFQTAVKLVNKSPSYLGSTVKLPRSVYCISVVVANGFIIGMRVPLTEAEKGENIITAY